LPCKQQPERGAVYVEGPAGWDVDPICSTYENHSRSLNEANARLIAAAPIGMELARLVLAWDAHGKFIPGNIATVARQFVAKAERGAR
jgi:hypothetical protein